MGKWAQGEFGVATLPAHAYLFAGPSSREKVDAVAGSFDEVLEHRQDLYERFLVRDRHGSAVLLFQLYGAPVLCDLMTVLKDGGVSSAFFFGTAYGIADDLRIADLVVPTRVQTLDGVSTSIGAGPYADPDPEMVETLSAALRSRQIPFRTGKSISVPATFWHGDESRFDPEAIALEMEFAAFCHCGATLGIQAAGLLVISDTREHGLLDEQRPPRDPAMVEAFRAVRGSSGRSPS